MFTDEVPWTNTCLSKDLKALLKLGRGRNVYPQERNLGQEMLSPAALSWLPGAQGCDPQPCPAVLAQLSRAKAVIYFGALGKLL